jgi:hypothetical protein
MNRFRRLSASLLLFFLFCIHRLGNAQTVNIEAATRYWELTDALRQDKPLTDAAWQELLALPANKIYVPGVFPEEALKRYRKAIEVVYMPRHDSLLQAKLQAKVWYYVLVNDYKQRETMFKQYVQEVAQKPSYLETMYTYAYQYLPKRAHTKVTDLHLYYTALGNDASSRDEGIVFSLNSAIEWNKPKPGILEAHEMHHQLRPRPNFSSAPEPDKPILWALDAVQNEGVADLIDKKPLVQSPDSADIQSWLLAPAPAVIQRLDSVLQVGAKMGSAALPVRKFYQRLYNGTAGHLPGFYMASIIEKQGYTPQMLATIDNPMAFFALYQRAASKDKTRPPLFAKASMAYLKKLEKNYIATARKTRPVQ